MQQTLIINAKADSWNVVARKHYRTYMRVCSYWKDLTVEAIQECKIKRVKNYPVRMVIHCRFETNRARDIDSLYVKSIIDTLVKSKVLEGDSLKYLNQVLFSGELNTKQPDQILIRLIEPD